MEHRSWRRSILPVYEAEGFTVTPCVNSDSFDSSSHNLVAFLISLIVGNNSVLPVIALNVEQNRGRGLDGCLNVDKHLLDGCQVLNVFGRGMAARPDQVDEVDSHNVEKFLLI